MFCKNNHLPISVLTNFNTICHVLYELLSTKIPFIWSEEHDRAFFAAKDMISKQIMNTHFDPDKESEVLADASLAWVLG